jgi:hypothetical protein
MSTALADSLSLGSSSTTCPIWKTRFNSPIGVHYPLAIATDDLKEKFGAVEAEELTRNVQPAQLARTIEATLSGSMLTWAFY